MFVLEIVILLLGIGFMAAGITQSKKAGQKKWHILTVVGIVPVLVSVFFFICTFLLLYGIQAQEPVAGPTENGKIIVENIDEEPDLEPEPGPDSDPDLIGSDWRTYRAYSEDLCLDDTGVLTFCLSPLDNKNGYAVYDSASGARVGTLLWETETAADWSVEVQLKDLDNDGIKEIGVPMTDGEVLWYHYRKDLEDTWPENKSGCFEKNN